MTTVKYNNSSLEPAPSIGLKQSKTYKGNGDVLSTTYTVTLNGDFTPIKGGVGTSIVDTEPSSWLYTNIGKASKLRKLFYETGHSFEVDYNNTSILKFSPHKIDIDLPDNLYTNDIKYNISLETHSITSYYSGTSITASESYLENVGDSVSVAYNNGTATISRAISAKGFSSSGMYYASSWCHSSYGSTGILVSSLSSINNIHSSNFDTVIINGTTIACSLVEGTYSINADYQVGDSGRHYVEHWTVNQIPSYENYHILEVSTNIQGLGNNSSQKLLNAQERFSGTTISGIIGEIWTKAISVMPFSGLGTGHYYASDLKGGASEDNGSIQYSCTFRVTPSSDNGIKDIQFTTDSKLDLSTGGFNFNVKGVIPCVAKLDTTIPPLTSIVDYLYNKNIIPSSVLNYCSIVSVDKNWVQDGGTFGFSMSFQGNLSYSSTNGIMIDRDIEHSLSFSPLEENIQENITLVPLSSYYDYSGFTYTTGIIDTLASGKNDILFSSNLIELPSSAFFDNSLTPSCMKLVVGNKVKNPYRYSISRSWKILPWSLPYIPTSIPVTNVQIGINRNFETRLVNAVVIPGKSLGSLFQNLQTYNNPVIDMNISVQFGFDRGEIKTRNYNLDYMFSGVAKEATFMTGLDLPSCCDAMLQKIIGDDIAIDRGGGSLAMNEPCALIARENDTYDPIGKNHSYNVSYNLINIGYRPL